MSEWVATEWRIREDIENHRLFAPSIHRMTSPFYEGERFAVRCGGNVLGVNLEWEWEPRPSERDEAFYKRCRFMSFDEARLALEKAAEKLGVTA